MALFNLLSFNWYYWRMEKLDIHIVGLGNLGSAFLKGLNNVEDINLFLYDDLESVRNSVNNESKLNKFH